MNVMARCSRTCARRRTAPGAPLEFLPSLMPKTTLTPEEVKSMILCVADAVIAAEPYLSEADRNLGDGDHGLGMQRGFTAVKEKIGAANAADGLDKLFSAAGMAMISSMGGASGAIFGTLFRDGGKALAGRTEFDAAGLAAFLRGACDGVQARGKAQPGDKTMVDALHPAAARAGEVSSQPLPEAIVAVTAAAVAGREASKAMIATLGRAKTLGEASIGHPDAGACSVAVILEAMRDYICA
jgi:phosphoenolpyruvate---glycerone phosphotransferase subunit DhaL